MSSYSSSNVFTLDYAAIIAKANENIKNMNENKPIVKSQDPRKASEVVYSYPRFEIPKTPDVTAKEFATKLVSVAKVVSGGPNSGQSQNIVKAAGALRMPDSKSTWSFNMKDMRHQPNNSMYIGMMKAGLSSYANPSTTQYRSNNTKRALLTRLVAKLSVDGPKVPVVPYGIVLGETTFESTLSTTSSVLKSLNTTACAGLPYAFYPDANQILPKVTGVTNLSINYSTTREPIPLGKPMPILEHALNIAIRMINSIPVEASNIKETKQFMLEYFSRSPELNTFLLKRKDEKQERSEWNTKVRPYGVQPLPTRLFCMWAIKPLEDTLLSFIQDRNSISAYHYSQFHGGANNIIEHFRNREQCFTGLAYGDDQLWQFKLPTGEIIMMTPDVSAMDMSTRNTCVIDIMKFLASSSLQFPGVNLRAIYCALYMSFSHDIHIGGPYIVSKVHSLLSGIPGTTIWNIFNSGRIQQIINQYFNKNIIDQSNFLSKFAAAIDEIKSSLGYSFKDWETLSFDIVQGKYKDIKSLSEAYPDTMYLSTEKGIYDMGIPLPFLSHKIAKIKGKFVSVPMNMFKFGASLVLPDSFGGANNAHANIIECERIAGVYFSGGWIDDKFSDYLRNIYRAKVKLTNTTRLSASEYTCSGEKDLENMMCQLKRVELPSPQFMYDFNTMEGVDFVVKYFSKEERYIYDDVLEPLKSSAPKAKMVNSKDEIPSYPTQLDAEDMDEIISGVRFHSDTEVPINKMGNSNANTITIQKQKDLVRQAKINRRADILASLNFVGSSKLKKKFQSYVENDDYETLFTEVDQYIIDVAEEDAEDNDYQMLKSDNDTFWNKDWEQWNPNDESTVEDYEEEAYRDVDSEEELDEIIRSDKNRGNVNSVSINLDRFMNQ